VVTVDVSAPGGGAQFQKEEKENMQFRNLAAAIERDILADKRKKYEPAKCFSCGPGYVPKAPIGDDSTRFCGDRCRQWFDDGNPPYDPDYASKTNPRWYSLPMGRHGFLIECWGCGKTFDSKGLRCCSTECERAYRRREENAATMAEVGMQVAAKRKCDVCQGEIPKWRNGRRVSKSTRSCSPKCSKKIGKAA
jgi:hypothetical protein